MVRHRRFWTLPAALLFAAGLFVLFDEVDRRDENLLPLWHDADGRSVDLERDLELMRETNPPGGPDPDRAGRVSTGRAIDAASRAFNTIDLTGQSRDEVIARLGPPTLPRDDPPNPTNFPLVPLLLVYRFDGGGYGWHFNVLLDRNGRVRTVERRRIH